MRKAWRGPGLCRGRPFFGRYISACSASRAKRHFLAAKSLSADMSFPVPCCSYSLLHHSGERDTRPCRPRSQASCQEQDLLAVCLCPWLHDGPCMRFIVWSGRYDDGCIHTLMAQFWGGGYCQPMESAWHPSVHGTGTDAHSAL